MFSNRAYKHQSCLDTAIYIHKIQYAGPRYIKVRCTWFLPRNGMTLGKCTEKIWRRDFQHWHLIETFGGET